MLRNCSNHHSAVLDKLINEEMKVDQDDVSVAASTLDLKDIYNFQEVGGCSHLDMKSFPKAPVLKTLSPTQQHRNVRCCIP